MPLLWSGRGKSLSINDCGDVPEDLTAVGSGQKLREALMTTRYARCNEIYHNKTKRPITGREIIIL